MQIKSCEQANDKELAPPSSKAKNSPKVKKSFAQEG
jgi:hypothetical protein